MTEYEKAGQIARKLGLSAETAEKAEQLYSRAEENTEDFIKNFTKSGGYDAAAATFAYLAARQNEVPLISEKVVKQLKKETDLDLTRKFDGGRLRVLRRRFVKRLGLDKKFIPATRYVEYYGDNLPAEQQELAERLDISKTALRRCYKGLLDEATEKDVDLQSVDTRPETFGASNKTPVQFAREIIEQGKSGASPQVQAAAALYIASQVF